jgi:hypothetical protein
MLRLHQCPSHFTGYFWKHLPSSWPSWSSNTNALCGFTPTVECFLWNTTEWKVGIKDSSNKQIVAERTLLVSPLMKAAWMRALQNFLHTR